MHQSILLIPIETNDISKLQKMAKTIWLSSYQQMISQEQITYMLKMMYGTSAILKAFEEQKEWYWVEYKNMRVGFVEIYPKDEYSLFLSKIYLKSEFQGKGIAQIAMQMLVEKAKMRGLDFIDLTVNKRNHKALAFYKKFGFKKLDSVVQDIGNGFVMDDYVLRYSVNTRS